MTTVIIIVVIAAATIIAINANASGGIVSGNLTYAQILPYAQSAGFSDGDDVVAAAIALAESSGNPAAVGDQSLAPSNGPSYGLWQINVGANPQFANDNLTDPQTNANDAYELYQAAGNSFSPWTTYTSGAYEQYLPQGSQSA
jgi:hypothetical protein